MRRSAIEVEEAFREACADGRGRDRAAGRTLEGPHRSDFLVRHRPKRHGGGVSARPANRRRCWSASCCRTRASPAKCRGWCPSCLLDEIAAHLDLHRRAALFSILDEIGCQAFMTGTEPRLFSGLAGKAQFFTVEKGRVFIER